MIKIIERRFVKFYRFSDSKIKVQVYVNGSDTPAVLVLLNMVDILDSGKDILLGEITHSDSAIVENTKLPTRAVVFPLSTQNYRP